MSQPEWNSRRLAVLSAQGLAITVLVSALVLCITTPKETYGQLSGSVRWPLVPLLALPVLLSWTCNGARFYLMCRCIGHPLSFVRAWACAVSSEFGTAATPGGVGGTAIRLGLLKKSGVPFAHGGALLAADLFVDLLFFSAVAPFALVALSRHLPSVLAGPAREWNPAWLLAWLPPLLLFAFRKRIFRSLRTASATSRHRLGARLRFVRKKWMHGLRQGKSATASIFRNHRGALVANLALSAGQFTCRYSILPLAIWMLGVPVDPLPLVLMQGALYMVSMVVVAPGGGGSVEILAALALQPFVPPALVGVAIVLWRLFTYHFYLLAGGAMFAATFMRTMRR